MRELILLSHTLTDAVNDGFIPAAKALGLTVTLFTDCAQAHREYFAKTGLAAYPEEIIACDVFNPIAVIDAITLRKNRPAAVFSNSDHLQSSTAIAASYLKLPGKDWHATYRAKNKAEMRSHLEALQIDMLWHMVICGMEDLRKTIDNVPYPCIVKPRQGVASQQVNLVRNYMELQSQCEAIWLCHPGQPLLLEEYIDGPLHTLETLGDGKNIVSLGGFQVTLSPPPNFIETEAVWGASVNPKIEGILLDILRRFGVGFGACHTEYVLTEKGPRLIEINYRNIGDHREFLLQDALQIPLFEIVLRLYLGEPLPSIHLPSNVAWIRYFTASSSGKLQHAPEAFSLLEEELRLTYKPSRKLGETIQLTNSNKDYLGILKGTGASYDKLASAISKASTDLVWEIAP
jgi:biotin carboxylase